MARAALAILLIAVVYLAFRFDLTGRLKEFLGGIESVVFIGMMAILPAVGAPVWVFLVLVGMKFGIVEGILLSAVLMFLHMAVTYYVFHSFLRERVSRFLSRHFNVSVPELGDDPWNWRAVVLMAVPGVPYAMKNCLLALAGLPFAPYITINWGIQYGLSIPMIILGSAVLEMNLAVLGVAVALVVVGMLVKHVMKKKYPAGGGPDGNGD